MLERKVMLMIENENMFRNGTRILVAVSGGADSVCLFHLLRLLGKQKGYGLVVAHLHHMLRPEADDDLQFVRELCSRYGMELAECKVDIGSVARIRKCSIEEAGRQERLAFFQAQAQKWECEAVALGHHKGDQAETILMNLLRGAGSNGLGGMRPVRDIWRRPLLSVSKEEIILWLEEKGYAWREDESNQTDIYNRNRIRHQLIPLLQEFNPRIVDHLSALGVQLKSEHDFLEEQTESFWMDHTEIWGHSCLKIPLSPLLSCPQAIRFRIWQKAYRILCGRQLERQYVFEVDESFVRNRTGCGLPGGVKVSYHRHHMVWAIRGRPAQPYRVTVNGRGKFRLSSEWTLEIRRIKPEESFDLQDNSGQQIFADERQISFPLLIRPANRTDGYTPYGYGRNKTVIRMLEERGFPGDVRRTIPVLEDNEGKIIWAGGLRIAQNARVQDDTPTLLQFILLSN